MERDVKKMREIDSARAREEQNIMREKKTDKERERESNSKKEGQKERQKE